MNRDNALVLLGGMMCDERVWARQCSDLRDRTTEIMIGDLTRSSSIEGMARDVLADAPERFALGGLSDKKEDGNVHHPVIGTCSGGASPRNEKPAEDRWPFDARRGAFRPSCQ